MSGLVLLVVPEGRPLVSLGDLVVSPDGPAVVDPLTDVSPAGFALANASCICPVVPIFMPFIAAARFLCLRLRVDSNNCLTLVWI